MPSSVYVPAFAGRYVHALGSNCACCEPAPLRSSARGSECLIGSHMRCTRCEVSGRRSLRRGVHPAFDVADCSLSRAAPTHGENRMNIHPCARTCAAGRGLLVTIQSGGGDVVPRPGQSPDPDALPLAGAVASVEKPLHAVERCGSSIRVKGGSMTERRGVWLLAC